MSEKKKAMIAMSGGVDSSVAAYLMTKEGYDCIGVNMKLYRNEDIGMEKEKTCCSLEDAEAAGGVARSFGMPFYVFNFTDDFEKEVIKRFVDTYIEGGTPNPCIECNRYMKFQRLMQRMYELSFDYIVTGHYARVAYDEGRGRYLLKKGVDASKDQSYVLYNLTQEQLSHTLFPLGEYHKTQIRDIAQREGFVNADKPDSQDICFVPDGDYASYIMKCADTCRSMEPGNFVLSDGTVVGQHKGIIHYTVGQRKGLGLALGHPVFVLEIRPETNEVVIGTHEESLAYEVRANRVNFMSVEDLTRERRVWAKIRYNHKGAWCRVCKTGADEIRCVFEEPQRAVTPGQAVVLYEGEHVLGGGTIIGAV